MLLATSCKANGYKCPSNSSRTRGSSAVTSFSPSYCIMDSLDLEIHVLICFSVLFVSSFQGGTCMSAGLKTPKRYQLLISNTAFRNFDIDTCTAIRTCSGCYQGQGEYNLHLLSSVWTVLGCIHFGFIFLEGLSFIRQSLIEISSESWKMLYAMIKRTVPSFALVILLLRFL